MSEVTESSSKQELQTSEPKTFKIPVRIEGLEYSFEGMIPTQPAGSLHERSLWSLKVPNWREQATTIEEFIKTGRASVMLPSKLGRFIREEGTIGDLDLTLNEDHLVLNHVGTHPWAMPPEHGYHNAKGIGSFLLRNFTTFADLKGLPSVLEPYPDGSSPLSDEATIEWYKRYGYIWRHELQKLQRNKVENVKYGGMVRMPQKPDMSQPIAVAMRGLGI